MLINAGKLHWSCRGLPVIVHLSVLDKKTHSHTKYPIKQHISTSLRPCLFRAISLCVLVPPSPKPGPIISDPNCLWLSTARCWPPCYQRRLRQSCSIASSHSWRRHWRMTRNRPQKRWFQWYMAPLGAAKALQLPQGWFLGLSDISDPVLKVRTLEFSWASNKHGCWGFTVVFLSLAPLPFSWSRPMHCCPSSQSCHCACSHRGIGGPRRIQTLKTSIVSWWSLSGVTKLHPEAPLRKNPDMFYESSWWTWVQFCWVFHSTFHLLGGPP